MHFAALSIHTRLVEATQQCGHDDLLIAFIDIVKLQDGALPRLKYFWQVKVLDIVEGKAILETIFDTPRQGVDGTRVVRAIAILIAFLFRDGFNGGFEISGPPGSTPLGLGHFAQGTV